MKNSISKKIVSGLAVLVLSCVLVPKAMAIGIRPLRYEITIEPGKTATGEVVVVNETDKDFSAEPILRVFYKNNDLGLPVYLSKEEQEERNKVEDFVSWIDLSKSPVLVPAKSEIKVPYTVKVPKNAKAGCRYATIAYQPILEPSEGIKVNVRAASLLYLKVQDSSEDIIRSGELINFGLPAKPIDGQPFIFETALLNTGNIHLKPIGEIKLTDLSAGKELGVLPLNLSGSYVLPASSRTYKTEQSRGLPKGSYRADLNLSFAEEVTPITQSLDFEVEADSLPQAQESTMNFETSDYTKYYIGLILVGIILIVAGISLRKGNR